MDTISYTTAQIEAMARRIVADYGVAYERFLELGRNDELEEPALRDFWLIWGQDLPTT